MREGAVLLFRRQNCSEDYQTISGDSEIGPDFPDDSKTAEHFQFHWFTVVYLNVPNLAEGSAKMTEDDPRTPEDVVSG